MRDDEILSIGEIAARIVERIGAPTAGPGRGRQVTSSTNRVGERGGEITALADTDQHPTVGHGGGFNTHVKHDCAKLEVRLDARQIGKEGLGHLCLPLLANAAPVGLAAELAERDEQQEAPIRSDAVGRPDTHGAELICAVHAAAEEGLPSLAWMAKTASSVRRLIFSVPSSKRESVVW